MLVIHVQQPIRMQIKQTEVIGHRKRNFCCRVLAMQSAPAMFGAFHTYAIEMEEVKLWKIRQIQRNSNDCDN